MSGIHTEHASRIRPAATWRSWSITRGAVCVFALALAWSLRATCPGCTLFGPGVDWGRASDTNIVEASGIAASAQNPGVLWTHNDGSDGKLYALDSHGALLATFDLTKKVDDVEDLALGPGPVAGVSYLYAGDIGGSHAPGGVRNEIRIVRVPEPRVDLDWAAKPRSDNFQGAEVFGLQYPDGSHDAETLLLDPVSHDLMVGTKEKPGTWVYRANLDAAANKTTIALQLVVSVPFAVASGGAVAADGHAILLRREDFAMIWTRCDGETVGQTLERPGKAVPVIGPPTEPNGEGIAFLPDSSGYVTISDSSIEPHIYFFQAQCPSAPRFITGLADKSSFAGGTVDFGARVVGYPPPALQWTFQGEPIPGQTNASLVLSNVTSPETGVYALIASNASGSTTNSATLTIRPKPDLRITEVESSRAPSPGVPTGDWWELTSFESSPVDLTGFRFNDSSGELTDPFVLTNHVVIHPNESVIWVQGLTPGQFRAWWGSNQVPTTVQIITYGGKGLGFSSLGDGVRLWGPVTADSNDTVARVDFGAGTPGVSFNYDPLTAQFGGKSRLGIDGVFRAALTSDIGSPGRIRAAPPKPELQSTLVGDTIEIRFEALEGYNYSLEMRGDLTTGAWMPTTAELIATNNFRASLSRTITAAHRFYRVRVQ